MRLSKEFIAHLAGIIVTQLLQKELIRPLTPKEQKALQEKIVRIVTEELELEDRLNEEVRELLKQYEREIEAGRLDYRKVFAMTKQKLARERNIIL